MGLFLDLYLGHLIADYALQPGKLVAAKREGIQALLIHVILVGLATTLVLWNEAAARWHIIALAVGAHFVIEKLTIATRVGTRTRGLFVFLFDQTLHVLSIAMLVWLAGEFSLAGDFTSTGTAPLFWMRVDVSTLALVDAFVTTTLLGSILAFETGGALAGGAEHDMAILAMDLPRIAGIVERGMALAVAVWLSPAYAAAAFVPRVAASFAKPAGERARSLAEGAAGLALCLLSYAGYVGVVSLTKIG